MRNKSYVMQLKGNHSRNGLYDNYGSVDSISSPDDEEENEEPVIPQTLNLPLLSDDSLNFSWDVEQYEVAIKISGRLTSKPFMDKHNKPYELIIFPNGNDEKGSLSVYLGIADHETLPLGWNRYLCFTIRIVNHLDTSKLISRTATNLFDRFNSDWGFSDIATVNTILSEDGYLKDGCLTISVTANEIDKFNLPPTPRASFYTPGIVGRNNYSENPREELNMVGIKNQGATCYLNSLLQTLFHTPQLRKAVYEIPTEAENTNCIGRAMQRVFYDLQTARKAISTKPLTKSFGWTSFDTFTQHDAQELSRILCDALEEKMENTPVDGTIQSLFEGKWESYVKCVDVDYESQRMEPYYDIQLDVKGIPDVLESFRAYTKEEILTGDNKYEADGFAEKQTARKGLRFLSFPPVLNLHLKRFAYDPFLDRNVKINDRFEFPMELNLDEFISEDVKVDVDSNIYILHSVLVHRGGVSSGHYYCYIRASKAAVPHSEDPFVEINDTLVRSTTKEEAVEQCFGDGMSLTSSNAYMLVYIRKSDWESVMCAVTVPPLISQSMEREREQKHARHLYLNIRVLDDDSIRAFRSYKKTMDHYRDFFADDDTEILLRVRGDKLTLENLKNLISDRVDIETNKLQLWRCQSRGNGTMRVAFPITNNGRNEDNSLIGTRREFELAFDESQIILYIREDETIPQENQMLLFLKTLSMNKTAAVTDRNKPGGSLSDMYFPRLVEWGYTGSVLVSKSSLAGQILSEASDEACEYNALLQWESMDAIRLLENDKTLIANKLRSGDILSLEITQSNMIPGKQTEIFTSELRNYVAVSFSNLAFKNDVSSTFHLHLDRNMSMERVAFEVGKMLGVPGSFLRLSNLLRSVHSCLNLDSALSDDMSLRYEILPFPLEDVERGIVVELQLCDGSSRVIGKKVVLIHDSDDTVGSLFEVMRDIDDIDASKAFLLSPDGHDIIRTITPDVKPRDILHQVKERRVTVWAFKAIPTNIVQIVHETSSQSTWGSPLIVSIFEDDCIKKFRERTRDLLHRKYDEYARWPMMFRSPVGLYRNSNNYVNKCFYAPRRGSSPPVAALARDKEGADLQDELVFKELLQLVFSDNKYQNTPIWPLLGKRSREDINKNNSSNEYIETVVIQHANPNPSTGNVGAFSLASDGRLNIRS